MPATMQPLASPARRARPRYGFASVYTTPNCGLSRGPAMSLGALMLGDPDFGGVCPGYRQVRFALRVPGGWWRIKGQSLGKTEISYGAEVHR